jgi:hypothetical protein
MARIDDLLRAPPSIDIAPVSPNAATSGKNAALQAIPTPDVGAILDGLLLAFRNRVVLLAADTTPLASATFAAIRDSRS